MSTEIERPVESIEAVVARLQRELEDLRGTLMNKVQRGSTGDIEHTLRSTPKPDTLFLQGQTLNRADYPLLWNWVVEQGLSPSVFGAGNGSTTFVLPDLRGRVLLGAGTLGADTYVLGAAGGAATRALVTANMPAHDHNVGLSQHEGHSHAIFNDGDHTGHFPGSSFTAAAGADFGLAAWNSGGNFRGVHDHGMSVEGGGKPHTVSESTIGSGTPFDVRQAWYAVNTAIWT